MMIVLVPPLAILINVAAVYAWEQVWMRSPTCFDFYIDALAGLHFVSVTGRFWRWSVAIWWPLFHIALSRLAITAWFAA
jgi:hypothetical protein